MYSIFSLLAWRRSLSSLPIPIVIILSLNNCRIYKLYKKRNRLCLHLDKATCII